MKKALLLILQVLLSHMQAVVVVDSHTYDDPEDLLIDCENDFDCNTLIGGSTNTRGSYICLGRTIKKTVDYKCFTTEVADAYIKFSG